MTQAPALRPDGTILDQPGYDAATELFFDPRGEVFPPISARPTKGEAAAALASLGELISEFPFVTPADRAVALSAILTGVARPTLPCAPMHAFSATEPGTGKGLLALLASVIATGVPAPAANYSRSEDEVSKVVGTALMEGSPIFCLDNIEHELKGAQLCTAITEPAPSVRILGRSESVTVKSRTFFLATGNNISVAADMTRRVMLCRLNAGVERPELRVFKRPNLHGDVKAGRPGYVAAVLTVLRAYIAAGRPEKPNELGSFSEWSNLVRAALIWLGEADPVETMEASRASDPRLTEREAVMTNWDLVIGDAPVTTADIVRQASTGNHPDFREALLAVARKGLEIDSHLLGLWIRKNKDRLLGNLKIVKTDNKRAGAPLWVLHGARAAAAAEQGNVIRFPSQAERDELEAMLA